MAWLWTLIAAVISYVVITVPFSFIGLFLALPIIQIGRVIKPLRIPMWFLSRYGVFALEVGVTIWLTLLAGGFFDILTTPLLVINALVLLGVFNTLYQFDMRLFASQSGPWAPEIDYQATT